MNTKTLKTQAYPSLLAGTGRQPLGFRGDIAGLGQENLTNAALNVLSLTGQALRFERPLPPPNFVVEPIVQDKRPIIAGPMRRPLLRLLGSRRPSDDLALALAWAFGRHKVRPHPFDLPKMDAFVAAHAEHLGLTAQHWAQQRNDTASEPQGYFDGDELDETTWARASPARRARFISERRRQDATAARALVESAWMQETADTRVRLLTALESNLSAEDQPFLEALGKDRAPRVRALAQRFLTRLSASNGDHPALRACLERIRRSTTGLLKKRATLTLDLPATVKEHEAKAWIREAFSEISCGELADALHLTEPAIIEAAEKDANLSLALGLMATQDRRFDLLEQLTGGQLSDAWEQLSQCGSMDLGMMTHEERLRWARILIRPYGGTPPASHHAWSWLHRSLEGPAPELLFELVLRSPSKLQEMLDENKLGSEWMEVLAALCPASYRGRLRELMMALDPQLTLTALPLLAILDSLEKDEHYEQ